MSRREVREHLFRLLFRRQFHETEELNEQIDFYFEALDKEPSQEEKDYIRERFFQVLNHVQDIDAMLEEVSKGWRLNRMGKVDLTILRIAVFEMQFDDEIPVGVAINEAVEIAKKYGEEHSPSFVNGLLGKLSKSLSEKESTDSIEKETAEAAVQEEPEA